jgi:predicted acylesterase/phospholipase RssA
MGLSAVLALVVVAVPPAADRESASLTLQGAASLGTYEAGFSWTIIRLARGDRLLGETLRPRRLNLEAISGSSAGSVNSLLAAAFWCEADDEVDDLSVDRNLLRDAWLPVGMDQLLPSESKRYTPEDGLFASSAFAPVVDTVQRRVFSRNGIRFRPGCRISVGFTLTRVVPKFQTLSGLTVQSQTAFLPLILEVDPDGSVLLRRDTKLPPSASSADRVALPDAIGSSGPHIPPDQVIQALLASAAFPLAFGARSLCECRPECGSGQLEVAPNQCPGPLPGSTIGGLSCAAHSAAYGGQKFKLCRSNFIDGGFLDNAPIGLAVDQAETSARSLPLHPLQVALLDPDLRRPRNEVTLTKERAAQGISDTVTVFNDLANTAREQRLAEAILSRRWNLTTRALLRRTASALSEFATILSRLEGTGAPPVLDGRPPWRPVRDERGTLGRRLDRCLRFRPLTGADLDGCVAAVEGRSSGGPAAPGGGARGVPPLSPEEVVKLAEALGQFIETLGATAPPAEVSRRSAVAAGAAAFLADELPHFASQAVSLSTARRGRAAYLHAASATQVAAQRATALSTSSLLDLLGQLVASRPPPSVSEAAASASTALDTGNGSQLFPGGLLAPVQRALAGVPEASLSEATRAAARRISLLDELRPRISSLNHAALLLAQDADEIRETLGQRQLNVATRFSPLAGEKLYHFAGFLDGPLRELDYYVGVYEGLRGAAAFRCSEQDLYLVSGPVAVLKTDGSWEIDPSVEETQRCMGQAMGEFIDYLQILSSPKAGPVVRALARRELAASLGSAGEANRLASTPEWQWLGSAPPDLRALGAVGVTLAVLLEPAAPCNASAKEPLCIPDLTFEQFLYRLRDAGYQPESKAMQAALADAGRWLSQTVHRALDRAGAIEIAQGSSAESPAIRSSVNVVIGGGETVSRSGERRGEVLFLLDPSTVPVQPLADGSYLPIVLAHIVPYRIALDVVGGSIALSWLEPRLQLGRWFSVDSTLQLIDLQFSSGVVSSTLGVRGMVHLGPVSVGSGPRWSLAWGGGSHFGVEFDLLILQDRLGVSFGFRDVSGGSWKTPFVALTIADLNGTLYWLIPPAWRSGR